MKWEELSMSDRSNLMKTYLQNGVTQLSAMRDHYNKFADGGEVDNVHSTQAQDFIASWLSNRQEQFRENFRNSGSTMIPYSILPKSWSDRAAFKEYQNQLKNLRTVKQYDVLGNTKFPHVPDSEFESIKKLSNHTGGAYNPSTHAISYISPYAGTDVHELTHSLNADPQINAIKYGFEGDKLQEGKQYNSYKDSANEIYSRLMQFRYLNKLDPTKKYSVEDIKKWREKYDDTDIVNRYTDEYLLHLLNNVASTKSSLEKDGRKLAAFGGPLRDEYDNPDQYYDYRTAEEVGDMYDPKSKHWASRDPRTGIILKNPKHPTFGMAIREDQSSGYAPFIDSSTGRYYTLRPEEYATAPNKHTLRKVSNSEMETLYKEHNIDSWSRRKDFGKVIPGYTREEIDRRRSPYRDTLWEAAKNNNLNPEILDALATVESRYDNDATSDAGAKGIMQLMPVNTEKIDPRDGHQNIRRGAEVLSAFLKKNKGDMKKAIAAYNGYTKNPGAKVAKEEKGYTDNYYKVLYPLIDSLEKNSTTGFPFDRGGELKRDSTRPTVRPYFAGNFQEQEPQYTGPVIGEIRADERSKTQKFFDKVKTDYNTSSFGNSAIAEVLSATTPYGLIHEGMRGNTDTALLSVVPFGAEIKGVKNAVKAGRVGLKTLIDSSDRPNIPELVIKGDSGISAYTADKYRGSLDDFAKYLKRPEVREKIPSVYKDRLNYFLRNLENEPIPSAQAVLVNKIPKRVSNFAIEHGLGPSTKVDYSNKLSKNVAGQYDPKTDLVTMGESIKEGIFYPELLPHEYNHWLDYDSSFGDMLRVQIPEKEEYLKSLINPYKRNKLSYYIHNPKRLWKKIADRMPYDYLTTPTEVRAYSSEVLQRKALEKELLQKQGLQDFVAPLSESFFKNSSPMGKELMRAIKPSKRAAFLKNLEERGFSEGGILKID